MRLFTIFFLLLLTSTSCEKDNSRLFTIPFFVTFEMPAGLNPVLDHHFVIDNIPSTYDNLLNQRNLDSTDVKTVNPGSAKLAAQFGNGSFDWIFEISVEIFHPDIPGSRREVFYRDNIPTNTGNVLDLIPTLVDVKDILKREEYSLDIILRQLRGPSPQFIETRLDYAFEAR